MTPQIFAQTHRSFDLSDNLPLGHDAEEDAHVPICRLGKTVAAAFLKRCARMLPTDWRILLWSKETDETIISSHGSVQIRRVPGGCLGGPALFARRRAACSSNLAVPVRSTVPSRPSPRSMSPVNDPTLADATPSPYGAFDDRDRDQGPAPLLRGRRHAEAAGNRAAGVSLS